MSVQVANLDEKNMVQLTIEVPAEELEKALQAAYNKQKKNISIPGFRKGKVPRQMIEKMYGPEVFYEDAANILIPQEYPKALDESGLDIVSQPKIEVSQLKKGENFIFTADVAVKPEVELGKYIGVTVTKIDTSVSDEEVDEEIEKQRNNNARTVKVEDRAIAEGDTANIDFEGFIDGEPFEGGKADAQPLTIGSHSFIEGFEEQLVGKNIGDDVEVNVTFPENYHAADLAGKPAVFKVKINDITTKELPELNDEFAQDVSEFDTLDAYKEDVKKNLTEQKENDAKQKKEEEAIRKIVEKSKMDIPEAMVETQIQNIINNFANQLAQQGLNMQQYMQFTGLTIDKLEEQVRPEAVTRIENSLVLEQIVKDENIEVTDEDLDAEMQKMADAYKMELDQVKTMLGDEQKDAIREDLKIQKAVDLVMGSIKERAKAKTKKDDEEETEA
ncbi:MAG: trigger factor [Lachnospiraceae bacterium]